MLAVDISSPCSRTAASALAILGRKRCGSSAIVLSYKAQTPAQIPRPTNSVRGRGRGLEAGAESCTARYLGIFSVQKSAKNSSN